MNAESLFTPEEDAELRLWSANILAPLRVEAQRYASALTFEQSSALIKLGLSPASIIQSGLVGVAQVEIGKNDIWSPAEHGPYFLTIAVNEEEAVTDIVAFSPDKPNEWFLRIGSAWALGLDNILEAQTGWPGSSVLLHETPLDWLRSGMEGSCVIDWTDDAIIALRSLPHIDVARPKFAAALRLQLSKPPRLPEIDITGGQKRGA